MPSTAPTFRPSALCSSTTFPPASRWSPTSSDSGDESGDADAEDTTECNDDEVANPLPRTTSSPLSPPHHATASRQVPRTRLSPLQPLSMKPAGPKSASPLSRSLLARAVSGASGCNPDKPKKTNKLIVPTKTFRTTFELGLSSTELARK